MFKHNNDPINKIMRPFYNTPRSHCINNHRVIIGKYPSSSICRINLSDIIIHS